MRRYDTLRLEHGGFDFRIVQRGAFLQRASTHQHGGHYTTDVYVREVKKASLQRAKGLLHELSWLLSFATYSDVNFFGYSYMQTGEDYGIRGNLRVFRPPFEIGNAAALKSFLVQTWPVFSQIWRPRKLNIIIRYLILADRDGQPAEVALLLSFVTLEMLKTTYANVRGIPLIGGQFRKISAPPKPNPKKERAYTFQELLKLMLREHVSPELRLFALMNTLRNWNAPCASFQAG
jgi:hypothetical protein